MGDMEELAINSEKNKVKQDMNSALSELETRERVKVPETVFVARFVDSMQPGLSDSATLEFAKIAGGYYLGVDVVKDGTDEVLYTTPPISSRPDIESSVKSMDMAAITEKTGKDQELGKTTTTLDVAINKVEDDILTKIRKGKEGVVEGWKLIHDRYHGGKEVSNNTPQVEDDDIDYDS